jgi:hypothetical protein
LPACTVQSASRSMKVIATALKEHGAYAPEVGAATHHPFEGPCSKFALVFGVCYKLRALFAD